MFVSFLKFFDITFYIIDTLKGKTKPNRISWLLWAIAPMIATIAAISDGVGLATLPVFMAGFGPMLVLIASFINKNSYWKLEKYDYLCGGFSILALILWGITKEPTVAIIFALISDGFASIPTIIKSWKAPETETYTTYALGVVGVSTSFLIMENFSLSEIAFPIYLLILNSSLTLIIIRGKFNKLSNKPQN